MGVSSDQKTAHKSKRRHQGRRTPIELYSRVLPKDTVYQNRAVAIAGAQITTKLLLRNGLHEIVRPLKMYLVAIDLDGYGSEAIGRGAEAATGFEVEFPAVSCT